MHKRDFLKTKIASTNDHTIWEQYKEARNEANNSIKRAKRNNLDANKKDLWKTWKLINELQSRQSKSTNVSQIKIGDQAIRSSTVIAEAFNSHYSGWEAPSLKMGSFVVVVVVSCCCCRFFGLPISHFVR